MSFRVIATGLTSVEEAKRILEGLPEDHYQIRSIHRPGCSGATFGRRCVCDQVEVQIVAQELTRAEILRALEVCPLCSHPVEQHFNNEEPDFCHRYKLLGGGFCGCGAAFGEWEVAGA